MWPQISWSENGRGPGFARRLEFIAVVELLQVLMVYGQVGIGECRARLGGESAAVLGAEVKLAGLELARVSSLSRIEDFLPVVVVGQQMFPYSGRIDILEAEVHVANPAHLLEIERQGNVPRVPEGLDVVYHQLPRRTVRNAEVQYQVGRSLVALRARIG